jgi:hypothetical protein
MACRVTMFPKTSYVPALATDGAGIRITKASRTIN